SPERETRFAYDSDFPNFLADTLVLDGAGAGKNMLTRNVPDANGRVAQTIIDPDGLALTDSFEYNKNGRKILHTDPNGNSTAFEYDGFNRLVRVVNPDATERLIEYDLAGRKTKTTSENGVETLYAYNANGLQTSRTIKMSASGADDIATQTSYSPCGKILSTTDPNGNATAFEYDGMGRLMQMTKFEGDSTSQTSYTTSYAYTGNCGSGVFSTDNFKPSSVTDPRGNTSTFAHDALYRETSITLPYSNAGSTTQYSYDAVGNKISETDALNNTTTFEYDAQNNLVKTTFADNSEKSATYSAGGLLLSETDEMGNTTTHEYDPAGRKIKTTFPSVFDGASNANKSPTEEYFYDKNGNLTGRKDANGNLWNFSYDSRNRKIAEIAPALPSGNSYVRPMKFTAYDGVGNPVSLTDANGNTTQNIYDNANRLVQITFPEVQVGQNAGLQHPVETRGYDKNGNLIEVVNPRGIKTQTAYNSFNKPTQITKNATAAASDQIVEAMSYDGNGNLVEITDGNGNKTRYEYDAMNRRTSAVYGYGGSLTRTDTWTYDALNMTNRKGVLLTYDSRNRIHTENSRTYAYDLCGRILSVSDSGNSLANVSYTYDALGRTVSETNGGKTHFYKYDLANNRIKSSYGSINSIFENATFTHTLSYAYDNNNRLISITDQQNRITTYSYDLNGNVVGKAHANGYEIAYTYDALNRLKSQSGTLLDNQYYYDLGGNVVYLVNSQNNSSAVNRWEGTLSYDAFDRLVSEGFYDGESFKYTTYTYDKNSNRTSRVLSCTGGGNPNWYTETINYTVNALNQVSSLTKTRQPMDIYNTPTGTPTISTWAMTYNARGNLAGISDGESMTSYVYDAYDMLVDAFKDIGEGANYEQVRTQSVYDYRGRRIKREVSSIGATPRTKTKEYSYADGVSVLETGLTGTTLTYRGSDQGGGVGGVNYTEYANGDDLNYKIYNLRGDVIKTIGANQATKSFSHYYAFGNHDDVYGSIPNDDFRANTKVEDDDNLLNEGKRFRHIELGIFLTPDPLEYVDGPNPYIYCNQNPWGRWDPEGLLSWRDTGSFAIDILPFAGTGKGGFELITGYDLVTGEPIPRWGSAIGLIGSVVPGGKAVVKGTLKAVVKKSAKESAEKITRSMAKEGGEALTKEGAKAAKETAEQVNEIIISRKKSPEAVRHLEDTDSIGREFTVDRQGAAQRRKQNIADKKKEPKKDRDEAPPAVFKESTKASVRNIPAGDNRSAGAQLGNQLRKIPDGEKVKIKIEE
ncbi:MAG: hypothetical protein J6P03_05825, partial [Opitutales bacterium]|nr:hypothetical protein [Opitutales bacterium]